MTKKDFANYLIYTLRHEPERLDLNLDTKGRTSWEDIKQGVDLYLEKDYTLEEIKTIVSDYSQGRIRFDKGLVEAIEGHTTDQFEYDFHEPPECLYYAVAKKNIEDHLLEGIRVPEGYIKLGESRKEALDQRYRLKSPVVLNINAQEAWNSGVVFYHRYGIFYGKDIPETFLKKEA